MPMTEIDVKVGPGKIIRSCDPIAWPQVPRSTDLLSSFIAMGGTSHVHSQSPLPILAILVKVQGWIHGFT
ncbi:hypothetical protein ACN38_g5653 [Penicillium nordicum]|uniref:Uncharacterized protein n=1 Tax=Penicillium nordicum TaxID=229535 RepID=A0A0M8P9Z1_9EURO|nr:hypothetical protein ACN38_g5653 [Penicillium nordicum]